MVSKDKKIFVAGANGMVGGAVCRELEHQGFRNRLEPTSFELDLRDQRAVRAFFAESGAEIVILAAARVGGILANDTYRADFIYDNLMIESNVIHAAFERSVENLVFLGSSCIYPKLAEQPMREEALLTGPLETTNEPYAIAKIAGIKLCESFYRQHGCNFFSVMPTNLYGEGDNFDLERSHVIPALIRKFDEARDAGHSEVLIWGSGSPRREFLYVDDLAEAVVHLMESVDANDIYSRGITHLNIGTGTDVSIAELAELVKRTVGFDGAISFDLSKPDGTPQKLLEVSRMTALGWEATTPLEVGLKRIYDWYLQHKGDKSYRRENTIDEKGTDNGHNGPGRQLFDGDPTRKRV